MPVLIYTVWGTNDTDSSNGVGTGSDVSSLVIYDNGLATWNQSNADGSGNGGCTGNCVNAVQLSSAQVNEFLQNVRRAGAFRQNSNNGDLQSEDSFLTTITVFQNIKGSVSAANTFSFYSSQGSEGRLGQIQNAFSQFFTTNFGTDGTGGGGTGSGGGS